MIEPKVQQYIIGFNPYFTGCFSFSTMRPDLRWYPIVGFNPYFTGCFSFRAADFSLIFDHGTETSPISPPRFFLEKYLLLYNDKKSYTNFPIGAIITPIRNYSFFGVITLLNNTQNTLYDFCQ